MEDFQKGVIAEKKDLDIKIHSLIKFIGSDKIYGVPMPEQSRLIKQQIIMKLYSEVLDERINNFA